MIQSPGTDYQTLNNHLLQQVTAGDEIHPSTQNAKFNTDYLMCGVTSNCGLGMMFYGRQDTPVLRQVVFRV